VYYEGKLLTLLLVLVSINFKRASFDIFLKLSIYFAYFEVIYF